MSFNKKIKDDNFINLDYSRIKDEVKENLNMETKPIKFSFHKYVKIGIIYLLVLMCTVTSIIAINGLFVTISSNPPKEEKYLRVSAEPKTEYTYNEYQDEGYKIFLDKLDIFAFKLNEYIYKTYGASDNYTISPVSLYMALAMLVEAGDEIMKNELLQALGMTYEEVRTYTSMLYTQLNDIYQIDSDMPLITNKVTVMEETMSNSIWIDDNILLKEEGLLNLSKYYNCSSYSVPFQNNNKKANLAIKDYMSESTKGLIDEDLELSSDTIFALMNTYYLKDVWNISGDELSFAKEEYYFNDLIKTKLLEGHYISGRVYETEMYKHFYIQAQGGTKIKFIIPNDGYTIDDINKLEVLKEVNAITDYNAIDEENELIYYTRCLFPEFESDFNENIITVLQQDFNINRLFSFNRSLTQLTDEEVKCEAVHHLTKLKVNKIGIEGAAVTVVGIIPGGTGFPYTPVYENFIVNKNFVVIVTDRQDIPLFTGVINNI